MKSVLKWASLFVLFVTVSCAKPEKQVEIFPDAPGVYGYIQPVVSDDPDTKATISSDFNFAFEMGDRINIWSNVGTLLLYSVVETLAGGGAVFDGGGFTLTEGSTYYTTYPLISNVRDDYKAISFSFEGQEQPANDYTNHVADYSYMWASATCENGRTHFSYQSLFRWIRFYLTLPQDITATELTLTADSAVFATDVTVNVMTAETTKVKMSDTMTLKLDEFATTGKKLNAYMAVSTYPACNVVVRVKDINGKIYESPVIAQNDASTTNRFRTITTTLEDANPTSKWALVTSSEDLTSGEYVIAYPDGSDIKLFSFEKTMTNAQEAAAMVADKHTFAEVVPMRTQLFQKCANGNYETVEAPADASVIEIPEAIEPNVAIAATVQEGETGNGTAVLKSTGGNLNFKSVIVALDADNAATITAAVDPTDFKNICNTLRGHELKFAFTDVMDYIAQEVELSDNAKACALDAFDKMCIAAKNELAEHSYDLGTIDRNTRLMDVFEQHYWFFADKSLGYDSDKALGWIKPVGFYVENDGFSGHIPVPVPGWFDELAASFNYGEGGKAGFVAYWQNVDTRYPKLLQVFGTNSFFGRIAYEVSQNLTDSQFNRFAEIDWRAVGQKYKRYTEDLNKDPLVPVYLYKKVQ